MGISFTYLSVQMLAHYVSKFVACHIILSLQSPTHHIHIY